MRRIILYLLLGLPLAVFAAPYVIWRPAQVDYNKPPIPYPFFALRTVAEWQHIPLCWKKGYLYFSKTPNNLINGLDWRNESFDVGCSAPLPVYPKPFIINGQLYVPMNFADEWIGAMYASGETDRSIILFLPETCAALVLTPTSVQPVAASSEDKKPWNEKAVIALCAAHPEMTALGNDNEESLLHVAVQHKAARVVAYLLNHGMDVNTRREDAYATPLDEAIASGDPALVRLLHDRGGVWSRSAVFSAVHSGNLEVVKLVVEAGAAVNEARSDGNPLIEAVEQERLDLATYLLDHGADPNPPDCGALSLAIAKGNAVLRDLLLARGVQVNRAALSDNEMGIGSESHQAAWVVLEASRDVQFSPLHTAVWRYDAATVKLLLERGANPNTRDRNGFTPLTMAVTEEPIRRLTDEPWLQRGVSLKYAATHARGAEIVTLLLAHHADPNLPDHYGRTPFLQAVESGYAEYVEAMLAAGAKLDTRDHDGASALNCAVHSKKLALVQRMLDLGVPANQADETSPVFDADNFGDASCLDLLVEHGAKVNAVNRKDGTTPLHDACLGDSPKYVGALLRNGADVNARDQNGWTPLHYAASFANSSVLSLLLEAGAQVNLRTKKSETPVFALVNRSKGWGVFEHLRVDHTQDGAKLAMLEELMAHGADIRAPDADGNTPLHAAAEAGTVAIVRCLLAHGVNPNLTNARGESPLHLAERAGNTWIVEQLLQHGANPRLKDKAGHVPAEYRRKPNKPQV